MKYPQFLFSFLLTCAVLSPFSALYAGLEDELLDNLSTLPDEVVLEIAEELDEDDLEDFVKKDKENAKLVQEMIDYKIKVIKDEYIVVDTIGALKQLSSLHELKKLNVRIEINIPNLTRDDLVYLRGFKKLKFKTCQGTDIQDIRLNTREAEYLDFEDCKGVSSYSHYFKNVKTVIYAPSPPVIAQPLYGCTAPSRRKKRRGPPVDDFS